jgi:hypothetical protein
MKKFNLHEKVQWSSQASGKVTKKTGEIVAIVPRAVGYYRSGWRHTEKLDSLEKKYNASLQNDGFQRDHKCYVVLVRRFNKQGGPLKGKLYIPRVRHLEHYKED